MNAHKLEAGLSLALGVWILLVLWEYAPVIDLATLTVGAAWIGLVLVHGLLELVRADQEARREQGEP
jgi:hypothetical protein